MGVIKKKFKYDVIDETVVHLVEYFYGHRRN